MKLRSSAAFAVAAAMSLALAACGSDSGGSGGSTSGSSPTLSSGGKGTIKIGVKFDQPGMGLKDGNTYKGLDVSVATYIANKLGYDKIEWVQAPSKQRETLISTGQVQLVVATYSITDKRKQLVSFAGPYFVAGQSILVKSDSKITGVKDLAGKKVCSVTGSTSVDNLKKQQPNLVPQAFDTYSKCAEALSNGVIDAMTTDDTILAGYANQAAYKGKLKLVGGTFSEEKYGVGLKKGDTTLCNNVTNAIKSMISDKSWEKFVKDNLGSDYKYNTSTNPPTPDACS